MSKISRNHNADTRVLLLMVFMYLAFVVCLHMTGEPPQPLEFGTARALSAENPIIRLAESQQKHLNALEAMASLSPASPSPTPIPETAASVQPAIPDVPATPPANPADAQATAPAQRQARRPLPATRHKQSESRPAVATIPPAPVFATANPVMAAPLAMPPVTVIPALPVVPDAPATNVTTASIPTDTASTLPPKTRNHRSIPKSWIEAPPELLDAIEPSALFNHSLQRSGPTPEPLAPLVSPPPPLPAQ